MRAVSAKRQFLSGRWQQSVPRHESNVTATTDIPKEVKRRYDPALKAGLSTPWNL
jgi:hypothetical protein